LSFLVEARAKEVFELVDPSHHILTRNDLTDAKKASLICAELGIKFNPTLNISFKQLLNNKIAEDEFNKFLIDIRNYSIDNLKTKKGYFQNKNNNILNAGRYIKAIEDRIQYLNYQEQTKKLQIEEDNRLRAIRILQNKANKLCNNEKFRNIALNFENVKSEIEFSSDTIFHITFKSFNGLNNIITFDFMAELSQFFGTRNISFVRGCEEDYYTDVLEYSATLLIADITKKYW
jgi:hypothetical protein